ncbi:hypothetical protein FB451DRAFT_1372421 [Mycena latifolia]|nr:hypothetical protein FB451DRAFT_1372421 [Mycena latifolia]
MPLQPDAAQIHFNHISTALSAGVTTWHMMCESLKAPFLEPISNIMASLLTSVQTVKRNQDDCARMLEQIHQLLYAIIHVHLKSDTGGELPPDMTLHKIHTFVEAQQEKSKIKQFFRQGEMRALLRDCQMGLEHAFEVFKIQGAILLSDMAEMQKHAQKMHEEVLEMISALSNGGTSDTGSTISRVLCSSLWQCCTKNSNSRAGGIGKTSLARAILHHPEISVRYGQCRVFVACDTASSAIELAGLIGAHVGLKPGDNLTQPVIRHFASSPPSLLILDNLETIWEAKESRAEVEKLLALLADIDHLALIITMRGTERPANVRWSRPFLEPLKPLTQDAAQQTFTDIADDGYTIEEIDKILLLVDNMPLAIDLIAHLVDDEGFSSVLDRWEKERTSLLSEGYDRHSNLDLSISISLESPRMLALPEAQGLLSLLSILPDGLSDTELVQSNLPIENVLACKAMLLCTSLAYIDGQKRLKALVPIREYILKAQPPMAHMIRPLHQHFQELLEVWERYHGTISNPGTVARIASNLANIHNILVKGLTPDNPDLVNTIYCACYFDQFSHLAGRGFNPVIDLIPNVLPHPRSHRLEVHFNLRVLAAYRNSPIANAHHIVDQTLESFTYFDDADLKCRVYGIFSGYFYEINNEIPRAIHFAETGLSLSISTGNVRQQSDLLGTLAWFEWATGNYSAGKKHAYEAQRLAKISGNLWVEAWAMRVESLCWYAFGSYKHSMTLLRRARDLLRLCGMSGGSLDDDIMNSEAEVHRLKSEYVEARKIQTQIMHHCTIAENPYGHAIALLNIALIDVEIGGLSYEVHNNLATARQLIGHSKGFSRIWCDIVKATLDTKEGDFPKAQDLFQRSVTTAWGKDAEIVSYCLERLGDVCLWPTIDHVSYNATVSFLVHSLKLAKKLETHKALQLVGDVFLAHGDQQTAMSLWVVALAGFTQMDIHCSRAECMLRLGDLSKLQGDVMKAGALWKTAHPLFERSSQGKQMADIEERLAGISSELLDRPAENPMCLSDLHAPTASQDELDLGLLSIIPSVAEEVESVGVDDCSDSVLVPA